MNGGMNSMEITRHEKGCRRIILSSISNWINGFFLPPLPPRLLLRSARPIPLGLKHSENNWWIYLKRQPSAAGIRQHFLVSGARCNLLLLRHKIMSLKKLLTEKSSFHGEKREGKVMDNINRKWQRKLFIYRRFRRFLNSTLMKQIGERCCAINIADSNDVGNNQ